jgi:flagellar basal-body rod protein FlgC
MSLFPSLGTASNGLHVYRAWMDSVSDNIANLNTVHSTSEAAFQARTPIVEAINSDGASADGAAAGARVGSIALSDPNGRLVYEPDHPLADAQGMVRYPDVDLGDQLTQLMMAQRGYQANLAVIDRVHDAYQQALQIGRM